MEERKKLLIADDEALVCALLRHIIRFDDLNLALAGEVHDGTALLRAIETEKPDIVVTDISMPGMDALRDAVMEKARRYFEDYIQQRSQIMPTPYLSSGIAYLRFAREEAHLFRFLFIRCAIIQIRRITAASGFALLI